MSVFELFISAIFVNNIVLAQYLGNCPYLGCSRDKGVAVGMGSAVIFVIFMATLCTWLMQRYVLVPFELGYLQTIVFILVIAVWCSLWKCSSRRLSRRCIPRSAFSCRSSPPTVR